MFPNRSTDHACAKTPASASFDESYFDSPLDDPSVARGTQTTPNYDPGAHTRPQFQSLRGTSKLSFAAGVRLSPSLARPTVTPSSLGLDVLATPSSFPSWRGHLQVVMGPPAAARYTVVSNNDAPYVGAVKGAGEQFFCRRQRSRGRWGGRPPCRAPLAPQHGSALASALASSKGGLPRCAPDRPTWSHRDAAAPNIIRMFFPAQVISPSDRRRERRAVHSERLAKQI